MISLFYEVITIAQRLLLADTLSAIVNQSAIRVFSLACAHNTITGILLRCDLVQFGPVQHARLYLVLYFSTHTVMVQLPMHVLHGIYYSLSPVVVISHLIWLTIAKLWCSPD